MRKKIFTLTVIFVISAISALMSLWLNEDSYSVGSRLMIYYAHKDYCAGNGPAPNQYRYLSYFLVEKVFKNIPVRWKNDVHHNLLRWVGRTDNEQEIKESRRNYDAFFPKEKRLEVAENIKDYLKQSIFQHFSNPVLSGILRGFVESISLDQWVEDPVEFFRIITEKLPEDFRAVFDDTSEISKIVNGYANFRFTFSFISLILLYLWLKKFLNDYDTVLCMFIFGFFYLYSMRYFTQLEAPLALSFFLALLLLIHDRINWLVVALCLVVGSFARSDHMLFAAVIYALYNFAGWKKLFSKQTIKSAVLIFIPLVITYLLINIFFPNARYYSKIWHISENFTNPWMLVGFGLFAAVPLFFADEIKKVEFFRKTWLWMIPFFAMNVSLARIAEVRLFLPMLAYLLPITGLGMRSLLQRKLEDLHT